MLQMGKYFKILILCGNTLVIIYFSEECWCWLFRAKLWDLCEKMQWLSAQPAQETQGRIILLCWFCPSAKSWGLKAPLPLKQKIPWLFRYFCRKKKVNLRYRSCRRRKENWGTWGMSSEWHWLPLYSFTTFGAQQELAEQGKHNSFLET